MALRRTAQPSTNINEKEQLSDGENTQSQGRSSRVLSTHLEGPAVLHEAESLALAVLVLHQLELPELDHLVTAAGHEATLGEGSRDQRA